MADSSSPQRDPASSPTFPASPAALSPDDEAKPEEEGLSQHLDGMTMQHDNHNEHTPGDERQEADRDRAGPAPESMQAQSSVETPAAEAQPAKSPLSAGQRCWHFHGDGKQWPPTIHYDADMLRVMQTYLPLQPYQFIIGLANIKDHIQRVVTAKPEGNRLKVEKHNFNLNGFSWDKTQSCEVIDLYDVIVDGYLFKPYKGQTSAQILQCLRDIPMANVS
ncbi:hypothetical protein DM02DRAFT_703466 [Periconia macrospinosa]|uniref:Uncharacterized protein n=1 Tax=Periconia macrospinosa TaxID=97972 RepID=A0A2V1EDP2_9PLEO|nr:hypothetical protein DM02DRAFT_703466 [Periconia macrospinosa]